MASTVCCIMLPLATVPLKVLDIRFFEEQCLEIRPCLTVHPTRIVGNKYVEFEQLLERIWSRSIQWSKTTWLQSRGRWTVEIGFI
jgi:hypothetical protein